MASVERVIQEHEQLDALATHLEACVESALPQVAAAVAIKAQLSMQLDDHLRSEDEGLYPRASRSLDATLADESQTMEAELKTLKVDWTAYLEEWSDETIESDWAVFGEETRSMMARLRARIARENACLVPLALQRSVLSLRAA